MRQFNIMTGRIIMLKKLKNFIPSYAVIPLIICVIFNFSVYLGSRAFMQGRAAHYYDMTLAIDEAIPVIPAFTIIYFGCYIFWIANYIIVCRLGKEHCYKYLFADLMGKAICLLFYLFLPTTNVRPEITGTGIFDMLLNFLYTIDSADNLFPSIHCLVSWYCYAGLRDRKEVSVAYKNFSLIFALLVCVSTLVTKQHVIVDVIAGVGFAELTWQISQKIGGWKFYTLFERKEKYSRVSQ